MSRRRTATGAGAAAFTVPGPAGALQLKHGPACDRGSLAWDLVTASLTDGGGERQLDPRGAPRRAISSALLAAVRGGRECGRSDARRVAACMVPPRPYRLSRLPRLGLGMHDDVLYVRLALADVVLEATG